MATWSDIWSCLNTKYWGRQIGFCSTFWRICPITARNDVFWDKSYLVGQTSSVCNPFLWWLNTQANKDVFTTYSTLIFTAKHNTVNVSEDADEHRCCLDTRPLVKCHSDRKWRGVRLLLMTGVCLVCEHVQQFSVSPGNVNDVFMEQLSCQIHALSGGV